MIEIRDISKKYRETFVLRHVSTRLPSDRMVAFIGSTGRGNIQGDCKGKNYEFHG